MYYIFTYHHFRVVLSTEMPLKAASRVKLPAAEHTGELRRFSTILAKMSRERNFPEIGLATSGTHVTPLSHLKRQIVNGTWYLPIIVRWNKNLTMLGQTYKRTVYKTPRDEQFPTVEAEKNFSDKTIKDYSWNKNMGSFINHEHYKLYFHLHNSYLNFCYLWNIIGTRSILVLPGNASCC